MNTNDIRPMINGFLARPEERGQRERTDVRDLARATRTPLETILHRSSIVLCHGFGFDSSYWNPLLPYLPKNRVVWDLGYFGEERKPRPEGSWIGIGHSFGLIHLMANLQGCCGLIGLQGFLNFLGDGDLRERRQRELSGLQKAFRRDPAKTLQSFYKACGASIAFSKLNKDPLQRDLDALELAYAVPDLPILLMGAEDDIIVPPELIYNNAASHSNVTVEILDRGKHALGHLHPKAVISLFQKHFNNFNENLAAQRPQS